MGANNKEQSRRDFLKKVGLGATGVALSSSVKRHVGTKL